MLELLATKTVTKETNATRDAISPALLNIFMHHHVVPFTELSLKVLAQIGAVAIKSLTPYFSEKLGTEVTIHSSKTVATLLTFSGLPYINAKEIKTKLPEALFFEISRMVKEHKKIPSSIAIDVGKEAKKFYEANKDLISLHASDTQSQLKSVKLHWKAEWEGNALTMLLVSARITARSPASVSRRSGLTISRGRSRSKRLSKRLSTSLARRS